MGYKEWTAYILLGVIISFVITKTMTAWLIPKLKSIKLGQKILDIGPRWHKNKEGTHYQGRCPRCMREIKIRIGEGGTSSRFFRAQ